MKKTPGIADTEQQLPVGNTGKLNPAVLLEKAKILKDSRTVKAGVLDGIFIKKYNSKGVLHFLRHLFQIPRPYRCRRTAEHLLRHGITTPQVLMTARNFLVTEAVDAVFCDKEIPSPAVLGTTLAELHNAKVYHGDVSLRNFYRIAGSSRLGVIDLDSARIYRWHLPERARNKDIARIISSYMIVTGNRERTDLIPEISSSFLAHYNKEMSELPLQVFKRVVYLLQRKRK